MHDPHGWAQDADGTNTYFGAGRTPVTPVRHRCQPPGRQIRPPWWVSGGPLFTTRGAESSVTIYRRELHPTHHTTARQKVSATKRGRFDPCNRHKATGSTVHRLPRI